MSQTNLEITLSQIRGILRLPPQASCADLVAKVRETKSAADLAGAALQIERDSSMAITPETFAAWDRHDQLSNTELMLFSDGSGTLMNPDGDTLFDFTTPAQFAAFFD
jgi:hypothetical protein